LRGGSISLFLAPTPLKLRLCGHGFGGNICHEGGNTLYVLRVTDFFNFLKQHAGSALYVSTLHKHLLLCGPLILLPVSRLKFHCTKFSESIGQCSAFGNRTPICVSAFGNRTQDLCCSYIYTRLVCYWNVGPNDREFACVDCDL
jgi:hypothetical protein